MARTAEDHSDAPVSHAKALSKAFRAASELCGPTVVKIQTMSKPKVIGSHFRGGENPFKGTPFERFFNEDEGGFSMPQPMPQGGVGSGVIIDGSGVILTNNHVVQGADKVKVILADGREFESVDVKTDKHTDLAVVRIKGAGTLPVARLGDSDALEIGDWVMAIGHPFDLDQTVSAGIISGKGRELAEARRTRFLQTDAAINPGNSGGPLINLDGEVIGINTAIASNSGGYQGIGFAVPSNLAKWVVDQLMDHGSVQRGYLGVAIRNVNPELAEAFNLEERHGALVTEVWEKTPAAAAGFQAGDLVVGFEGKTIKTPSDLQEMVERVPLGTPQSVTVLRDGKRKDLEVTIRAMPEEFGLASAGTPQEEPQAEEETRSFSTDDLGMTVRDATPEELAERGFEGHHGVLVTKVAPEGVAAASRIRPDMLIMAVGRGQTPVTNVAEFEAAVQKESIEKGVLLLVRFPQRGQDFILLKK